MQTALLGTIGTRVQRYGINATVMAANQEYAFLEYENLDQPSGPVTFEQLEAEFGNSLQLVKPKKSVQTLPKTLTIEERLEIEKRH
jgi:hypothetical protein